MPFDLLEHTERRRGLGRCGAAVPGDVKTELAGRSRRCQIELFYTHVWEEAGKKSTKTLTGQSG